MWFTADTHFGHEAIIKYDKRPFTSVRDHDETIIRNWNEVVRLNDDVWHLGDFAFLDNATIIKYLERMNGRIHFVKGNHDDKRALKCWDSFASWDDAKYLRHNNQKLYLHHYPCHCWRGSHKGSWHLYGHVHGSYVGPGKCLDVGIMNHNYYPIHFDAIRVMMDSRPMIYHHPGMESQEGRNDKNEY